LLWALLISAAISGDRAQIDTARPARRATVASAVPHAPAPTMAIR
jgi:hypothetical protein